MTIKPCLHYQRIGFGNNMAIRASVLREIGRFKEWLGPGSIGGNAEDAEIALRMLVKGYKILYNPNMLVYHNKWLNNKEMKKQNLSYICGEMACYGYFHFHGRRFASPVIRSNLRDSYHGFRQIIKRIVSLRWSFALLTDTYGEFLKVVYRVRGLLVARYFSLVDPIR